ncbi:hypothetical protein JCM8202_001268 [Rhodotorula sphaerocarpa]
MAETATATSVLHELPVGGSFATLKLESAGSPAPWTTTASVAAGAAGATAAGTEAARPDVLLQALGALSVALAEQAATRTLLREGLETARGAHADLRRAVHRARDDVLAASKAAQNAHTEARRTQRLKAVFRAGADRIVAALDRRTIRALRKGKWRAVENGTLGREADVSELLVDLAEQLELSKGDGGRPSPILQPGDGAGDGSEPQKPDGASATTDDDDDEIWRKIEEDLLEALAARVLSRASPTKHLRLPDLDTTPDIDQGDESNTFTFPLSPASPTAVPLPELERTALVPPHVDLDTLMAALRPIVQPVLRQLARCRRQLQRRIDAAEETFQDRVRGSTAAVDAHRLATSKAHRAELKIRNLEGLERRERTEEARLMDELRATVVQLAHYRKYGADAIELVPDSASDGDDDGSPASELEGDAQSPFA